MERPPDNQSINLDIIRTEQSVLEMLSLIPYRIDGESFLALNREFQALGVRLSQSQYDGERRTLQGDYDTLRAKIVTEFPEVVNEFSPSNYRVSVKNQKGEKAFLDLEKIVQSSLDFYKKNNLREIATACELPEKMHIGLIERLNIFEAYREGHDMLLLMPPAQVQRAHLEHVATALSSQCEGLPPMEQYNGMRFFGIPDVDPLSKITIDNRPEEKPYLIAVRSEYETVPPTGGIIPDRMRQKLFSQTKNGMTLFEYLVFQRHVVEKGEREISHHPDTQFPVILFDSRLRSDLYGMHEFAVRWSTKYRQLEFFIPDPEKKQNTCGIRDAHGIYITQDRE